MMNFDSSYLWASEKIGLTLSSKVKEGILSVPKSKADSFDKEKMWAVLRNGGFNAPICRKPLV